MRVIKLNEALEISPQEFDNKFKNSNDAEKTALLQDVLINHKISSLTKVPKLLDFGNNFISRWVEAMNSKELLDPNNEFITFLRKCREDLPIFSDTREFMKAYNAYANGYFSTKDLNSNNSTLTLLLNNHNLYDLNENDFKNVLRVQDYYHKKLGRVKGGLNQERKIFFEDPKNPSDSKINSLETIYSISDENNKSNSENKTWKERIEQMSDSRFKEFVAQLRQSPELMKALGVAQ